MHSEPDLTNAREKPLTLPFPSDLWPLTLLWPAGDCCPNRLDDCSRPILDTLCYCDAFCDRGASGDCCPDYFTFCLGEAKPDIISKWRHCGGIDDVSGVTYSECSLKFHRFLWVMKGTYRVERNYANIVFSPAWNLGCLRIPHYLWCNSECLLACRTSV